MPRLDKDYMENEIIEGWNNYKKDEKKGKIKMEYNTVIIFNDDNHDSLVWLNGTFVGFADKELSFLGSFIENLKGKELLKVNYININNIETNTEEENEKILNFFWKCNKFTKEQEKNIFNENWDKLLTIIE